MKRHLHGDRTGVVGWYGPAALHEAGAPTLYALGADRWRLAGDQRQRPFQ